MGSNHSQSSEKDIGLRNIGIPARFRNGLKKWCPLPSAPTRMISVGFASSSLSCLQMTRRGADLQPDDCRFCCSKRYGGSLLVFSVWEDEENEKRKRRRAAGNARRKRKKAKRRTRCRCAA